ncbi:MAG: pilus assembly protein PilO [Burkholderiales bacterium RIFCSPLOWO2_12_67_14]|jgi:type IV pilus assembly protein PilO|nr:MAG: pilus assembly protein PilO [Burkholderiales bacterium RIFCSPLOWO2_02_FULL_67_64]OGB41995.1 MAG: pilus assembly protein PilO [Burkholderiales bacterium RIFCSPLOWO2_12_67_14]OGB49440.1 MAG: pilus assembly protein PilO [Burkholderiales bacterium RIFCSPHIGHO2_12_FULL_67_38]OGB98642.1 MAG: pilus assembly protein PilO [Burkholderiales bacterium RIFCSPLOWO2_12_FULL_67_210]
MAKTPKMNLDLKMVQDKIQGQFKGLDPNDPSQWPLLPRGLLFVVVCAAVIAGMWFAWLKSIDEELLAEKTREEQLREDYRKKLVQAVNLDALKKQLEQVQQYVSQLEKQLPSKAEMDALLSDINQAGLGRSLQFELFRPGQVVVKEYYAELPITVRVTGRYHDVGLFAADIANLSRIVTLNNLSLVPVKDRAGVLTMDGTAKTFRYLDQEEIALQQQSATKNKGAAK